MQREEGLRKLVLSINGCNKRNASILSERTLSLVSKYLIFNYMVVLVWREEKKKRGREKERRKG